MRHRSAAELYHQYRGGTRTFFVYDFLVGNTDAHIKNFSLLYSPDMKRIRFAPAYDLVSTTVYEQSTATILERGGIGKEGVFQVQS